MSTGNPIEQLRSLVAEDLTKVDHLIIALAQSYVSDLIPEITAHITSSGGKRLRPLLTLACAQMHQDNYVGENHIMLASAIEFIHTATLLHDDVIDKSKLRRGVKTANRLWGEKASILVGDYLFSQAFKLMVRTGSLEALELLSGTSAIIAEAEIWQLQLLGELDIQREDYMKLINAKTAMLFAAACSVGGIAAGVPQAVNNGLYKFGLNFGIGFQIIDDFLDYFAVDEHFGKQLGNDFLEGKITLPVIIAYKQANEPDRVILKKLFTSSGKSQEMFLEVKEILKKYSLEQQVSEIAFKYANKGYEALQVCADSARKKLLEDLILYAIRRQF